MNPTFSQRHSLDVNRGPGMVAGFTALKKEMWNIDCSSKKRKVFINFREHCKFLNFGLIINENLILGKFWTVSICTQHFSPHGEPVQGGPLYTPPWNSFLINSHGSVYKVNDYWKLMHPPIQAKYIEYIKYEWKELIFWW